MKDYEKLLLHEFISICSDNERLVNFLQEKQVLPREMHCPLCQSKMRLDIVKLLFKCRITKNKVRCSKKLGILRGTIFDNCKKNIRNLCKFFAYKLTVQPSTKFLVEQLKMSEKTVIKYNRILRRVCRFASVNEFGKIGGENQVVEVDETRFGPDENSKESEKGYWIVGGVPRDNNGFFAEVVEDRTTETVVNIIKKYVRPGSTIYTDRWKEYSEVVDYEYSNMSMNNYNYVDSEDGAQTELIKNMWQNIKNGMPKRGKKKSDFEDYFHEYMFIKNHDNSTTIIPKFFSALKYVTQYDFHPCD